MTIVFGILYMMLSGIQTLVPVLVLLLKLGAGGSYNIIYIGTTQIFPTRFGATAFGIASFFGRMGSILSPIIAELHGATPMLMMIVSCICGTLASVFIIVRPPQISSTEIDQAETMCNNNNI
jgi:OCT family organic cation transporter-like MFS transporter 4/5